MMKKIKAGTLDLWQFESLCNETGVNHFVSDRKSAAHDSEFTLSYSSSPDQEMIRTRRNLIAEAMGVDGSQLYFPSQVHKTRIVNVTRETQKADVMETDSLITNQPGICIAVMSADCVPILLYDKKNNAVGAVHSGWKGTVARILEKTLQQMHSQFGTTGDGLIACIGPSVSQDSYEVGGEVVEEVRRAFGGDNELMISQPNNKAKLDLWKANQVQLREFGVSESQIELSNLCTVKNNRYFFSARKGDSGRFAAGIVLNS